MAAARAGQTLQQLALGKAVAVVDRRTLRAPIAVLAVRSVHSLWGGTVGSGWQHVALSRGPGWVPYSSILSEHCKALDKRLCHVRVRTVALWQSDRP